MIFGALTVSWPIGTLRWMLSLFLSKVGYPTINNGMNSVEIEFFKLGHKIGTNFYRNEFFSSKMNNFASTVSMPPTGLVKSVIVFL